MQFDGEFGVVDLIDLFLYISEWEFVGQGLFHGARLGLVGLVVDVQ